MWQGRGTTTIHTPQRNPTTTPDVKDDSLFHVCVCVCHSLAAFHTAQNEAGLCVQKGKVEGGNAKNVVVADVIVSWVRVRMHTVTFFFFSSGHDSNGSILTPAAAVLDETQKETKEMFGTFTRGCHCGCSVIVVENGSTGNSKKPLANHE